MHFNFPPNFSVPILYDYDFSSVQLVAFSCPDLGPQINKGVPHSALNSEQKVQKIREITFQKQICKIVQFDRAMHCLPQRLIIQVERSRSDTKRI